MKTIIAGREIEDYGLVSEAMNRINWRVSEIVSGGSEGIEKLGERWAAENNLPTKTFSAEWDVYGKAASHIRNAQMSKYADALVAIWDGKQGGISNLINEAKDLGLKVVVFLESELRDKKGSNPIKSNPIFGEEAENRAEGRKSSTLATKTITLNGRHLVVYEDPKNNNPLTNMVIEIVEELNRLKSFK